MTFQDFAGGVWTLLAILAAFSADRGNDFAFWVKCVCDCLWRWCLVG